MVKKKWKSPKTRVQFEGRSYKSYNPETFSRNLLDRNWDNLYQTDCVSEQWEIIYTTICEEADKQCPIKTFHQARPPFINKELMEQMLDRDYFYKKAKRTKSEDAWNIAKFLRNRVNGNIKRAKSQFITQKLREHNRDSARFWRTIKAFFPGKKNNTDKPEITLEDEGKYIENDKVATYINDFFINVGNTAYTDGTITSQLLNQGIPDLTLQEASQARVYSLTKNLSNTKSSGIPTLGPTMVKDGLKALHVQLTHIINTSLKYHTFPNG